MRQFFNTLFFLFICCVITAQPTTPAISYIKVDQFGYKENSNKVAVISDPQVGFNAVLSFSPGATYELREWFTGAVVFSSNIQQWNGGATHDQSGDAGWWFDFSSITAEGDYYVFDPTNNVRSHRFKIDDDVYNQVLKSAMRAFYYNRCGIAREAPYAQSPWLDATSFTQDAKTRFVYDKDNEDLEKDMSGGWYDAGDFNKYVTYTGYTLHNLLWAYTENPTVFSDNWDLPESGNGIPDIIDEIKWELDWVMKMNNADGSTHIKMGSQNYSDNTLVPPSLNTDTRFYGRTCSSAEIATASMFAHAALVFEQFPGFTAYAAELEQRAITTWAHVLPQLTANNLDLDCDDKSEGNTENLIISGEADLTAEQQLQSALKGAIYLYDLTGDASYQTYISSNLSSTKPIQNNDWETYSRGLNDALLHYTTLSGVSSTEVNIIRNSAAGTASNTTLWGMSNTDLYRAHMPGFSYHWGSNRIKATAAQMSLLFEKYNIIPANNTSYRAKAEEHVHYMHGQNPLAYTYLINMRHLGAEKSVNEMYHHWFTDNSDWDDARTSLHGPAPGYVTGGPNNRYMITNPNYSSSPLLDEPDQKAYLDINTSSLAEPSWELTEPAIYSQATYVRMLAAFSSAPASCPPAGTSCDDGDPKTTSDTEDGFCACTGECPAAGTPCDDGDPLTRDDAEDGACFCEGIFGPPPVVDCELITNGDFDNDSGSWFTWGGAIINHADGAVSISNITGSNPWDAAFAQNQIDYVSGTSYTLSFDISASANRPVVLKMSLGDSLNTPIFYDTINVTTTNNSYSFSFTNNLATTSTGSMEFQLGDYSADVMLDNISIFSNDCTTDCTDALTNGNFDTDADSWTNWGSDLNYANGAVSITNITGPNPWDAALVQDAVSYVNGVSYNLTFDASALSNRTVEIKIGLGDTEQTSIHYESINLTTEMTTYSIAFTNAMSSTTTGRMEFQLGSHPAAVTFDNVSILADGCSQCPVAGTACDDGDPLTINDQEDGNCVCSGTLPPPTSCELITNGLFDTDASSWFKWGTTVINHGNGEVSLTNNGGANTWDCAFAQDQLSILAGTDYTLTFNASASALRTVYVKIGIGDGSHAAIHDTIVTLTPAMTSYTIAFTNDMATTTTGTMEFQLGGSTADVTLDDVSLSEDGCSDCPNGEVELLTNGSFDVDFTDWNLWGCAPQIVNGEAHLLSIVQDTVQWNAGMIHRNILFQNGDTYQISFDASSDTPRDIYLKVSFEGGTYNYAYEQVSINPTMTNYSYSFEMTDTTRTNGSITLFFGNSNSNVYLDNVSISNGECISTGCEQIVYMTNPVTTGTYGAELELSSDAVIVAPDVVDFHAGNVVELLNNFEVKKGAVLHAYIAGCN